ncbi:MAG: hemolysin activation/secretion protein, partial [Bradyrhizobium sp.]|nr:hemolysin activation/secretion protein [Bradyrhizobium sp.]
MRHRYLVLCVGLLALMRAPAMAQVQPPPQINPGLIENDIERQRRRIEQQQQIPKQGGPAVVGPQRSSPVIVPGGGQRFRLRAV